MTGADYHGTRQTENRHNQQVVLLHKLEDLRERLVTGDDTVTEEAVALFPHLDRQQLRALIRNAKKSAKAINRRKLTASCSSI